MYKYQNLDFGFIILCPDRNIGGLRGTVRSTNKNYPKSPKLCVVSNDTTKQEMTEFSDICPTYKGKESYASMINLGLKKARSEWNFILVAGTHIKTRFYHKYAYFIDDEKDILFPIADGRCNFVETTLNGLLFNKKAIQEVGEFRELALEEAKTYWAAEALEKGYRLKAILGARTL